MDDLVEWLRAQLDEDERDADGIHRYEGGMSPLTCDHIVAAGHDRCTCGVPARVLREVEADRMILDVVAGWKHHSCQDGWYSCSQATEENGFPADETCADDDRAGQPCDCGLERRQMAILRPLAFRFADRPGYRSEWAPSAA